MGPFKSEYKVSWENASMHIHSLPKVLLGNAKAFQYKYVYNTCFLLVAVISGISLSVGKLNRCFYSV